MRKPWGDQWVYHRGIFDGVKEEKRAGSQESCDSRLEFWAKKKRKKEA